MSCQTTQSQTAESAMTLPELNTRKTSNEVLEACVEMIEKHLAEQQNSHDSLSPILYTLHARALRALQQYHPRGDEDTSSGKRSCDPCKKVDAAILIAAARAAALCEDALEYYEAGWRLEVSNRSNGGKYARWRRSTGGGRRETRYLGVIKSCKPGK